MRYFAPFALLALGASAQEVVTLPTGTPRPGAWTGPIHSTTRVIADPQLRANVMVLIDLTGDRDRLVQNLPKILANAKAKMMQSAPGVSPAFGDEWERRTAALIKVDDFVELAARSYEKHFTNDEVLSLIALTEARKAGKTPTVSRELQQKFTTETPAMMGEIVGAGTELAVRLGAQVGSDIGKEHPEYFQQLQPQQPPPQQPQRRASATRQLQ
jgi:hypothetical protein